MGRKKAERTIASCVALDCAILAVLSGRDVERVWRVATWGDFDLSF